MTSPPATGRARRLQTAPPGMGVITLRHDSRLHHIGMRRRLVGTRVIALVDGLRVRVITEDGELIRALTLDPTRDSQPHGES